MSKISELSDGGSLQSTDYLIAVRSGGNVKVQADGNLSLGTVTADGLTVNSGSTDEVARFEGTGSPYISWYDTGVRQAYIGSFGNTFSIVGDTPDTTVSIGTGGTTRVTVDSTGIDVTGTVTADGLTVDNSGDIRLGFSYSRVADADNAGGFASGYNAYVDGATVKHDSTGALSAIHYYSTTGVNVFTDESAVAGTAAKKRALFANNGDISFYEDTGTTPKFFWDASAESLGIGTTSPSQKLDVTDGAITAGGAGTVLIGRYSTSFPNPGDGYFSLTTNNTDGTNGGISFNTLSSGTLSERARIDSNGRVGIGVSSPLVPLHVQASSGSPWFLSKNNTDELYVGVNTSFNLPSIESNTAIRFSTGASFAEAMRIDASGNLLVGTTNPDLILTSGNHGCAIRGAIGFIASNRASDSSAAFGRTTTSGSIVEFYYNGVSKGNISTNGTTVSYNTSSDARLKENIADAEDASSLVDAIKVRQFDWKADGSHQRYGMVAQELLEVAPEAVSQGETEEDMMGVDYSKLVPMLVKEIQSLRARVHALESK